MRWGRRRSRPWAAGSGGRARSLSLPFSSRMRMGMDIRGSMWFFVWWRGLVIIFWWWFNFGVKAVVVYSGSVLRQVMLR